MITLRDYQGTGVGEIRKIYGSGKRSVLYVLPTGGGKTVVFCYIACAAQAKKSRVWILVHREELVDQTSRALDRLGVPHGLIAPGYTPSPQLVQVASVQTLIRRIDKGLVGACEIIVIDEAHHATAGSWRKVITARPDARLLGVTATPERLDGKGLGSEFGGVFDAMVQGPTIGQLIADGFLCQPIVYAPPSLVDLKGLTQRGGDYAAGELAERMDRPVITGDAVKHYSNVCPGAPAIAFCASVEHAKHVAAQFRGAGYTAQSLDGKMADSERRELIEGLGAGRLNVLTSCEIVSEGTDIPVVTAAILLRPTRSVSLYLQQVGRAGRPVYAPGFDLSTREGRLAAIAASGKHNSIILDHVGNAGQMEGGRFKANHGLPDQDREWSLEGARERNKRKNGDKEPPIRIQQCPKCFAAHAPAPKCPACGHVYQTEFDMPTQGEGELQKITAAAIEQEKKEKKREVGRASTLEELRAIAAARGYKEAWADHVWKARQQRVAP